MAKTCVRVGPTLTQVFATYGDRVKLVYREYPLPNHQNARPASEAGQCANEQGKFWPYHDKLFANQQRLSTADLKQYAVDPAKVASGVRLPSLHSSEFQPLPEPTLRTGIKAMTTMVTELLKR